MPVHDLDEYFFQIGFNQFDLLDYRAALAQIMQHAFEFGVVGQWQYITTLYQARFSLQMRWILGVK